MNSVVLYTRNPESGKISRNIYVLARDVILNPKWTIPKFRDSVREFFHFSEF